MSLIFVIQPIRRSASFESPNEYLIAAPTPHKGGHILHRKGDGTFLIASLVLPPLSVTSGQDVLSALTIGFRILSGIRDLTRERVGHSTLNDAIKYLTAHRTGIHLVAKFESQITALPRFTSPCKPFKHKVKCCILPRISCPLPYYI
jgi:hypothetical protein